MALAQISSIVIGLKS